jgi:hypothetical protein
MSFLPLPPVLSPKKEECLEEQVATKAAAAAPAAVVTTMHKRPSSSTMRGVGFSSELTRRMERIPTIPGEAKLALKLNPLRRTSTASTAVSDCTIDTARSSSTSTSNIAEEEGSWVDCGSGSASVATSSVSVCTHSSSTSSTPTLLPQVNHTSENVLRSHKIVVLGRQSCGKSRIVRALRDRRHVITKTASVTASASATHHSKPFRFYKHQARFVSSSTFPNNGCLGYHDDEERGEMR